MIFNEHRGRNPDGERQAPGQAHQPVVPGVKLRLLVEERIVLVVFFAEKLPSGR
jgi:hypothetical protein